MKLNNKIKIAGITLLTAITFGALGTVASTNNTLEAKAYSPSTTYTNGDGATYYNGISSTATGTTLLSSLQTLNNSKRRTLVGYSAMGTSPSGAFAYTDYDPSTVQTDSKGQKYGTKILSFYSGASTTSWNREHVWPNSHGGGSGGSVSSPYVDSDIHMPRPTISSENSNRGNSFYVEGMAHSSNGWDPVTAFGESNCYNGKSIRGECARIIFYCMVADNDLKLADSATVSSESGCTMGKLSDMLKWNLENPVNSRELNRNEGAEYLQGNRNPFVDHPEYACKIWGNTNDATKRICGNAATDTRTMTKITVTSTDSSNYYVSEGRYITLKATATYSDSSTADITNLVTWTSANSSFATVDQTGKVTGVAGSASGQYVNITATYGTLSGTHGVSVWTTGEYGTLVDTDTDGDDESYEGGQILASDLATAYETTDTLHTAASGIKFYTNNCAHYSNSGKLQFKKGVGYLYSAEALDLKSITISNPSGGTLSVAGGTTMSSISTAISGVDNVYDLTGYKYFKVSAGSSASYCESITVTTQEGGTTPTPTDSISLDKSSLSINVGSTGSLVATSTGNVTWKSSNTGVATVSASGTNNKNAVITGISAGNAVIAATCGTKSVTCNVTVYSEPTPATWPYKNDTGYLMSFNMSSTDYYFAGDTTPNYSYYGSTTTTKDDACLVYFEDNLT
ncbi:MAG: endonuclease, partial [Clostridia bacterium]|nr:endonuclease [Clostridia bacterium]